VKPGQKQVRPINPKFHFEGTKTDKHGDTIYLVIELRTGKQLEWNEETFKKNESLVEY
jgi:hypothetical protein